MNKDGKRSPLPPSVQKWSQSLLVMSFWARATVPIQTPARTHMSTDASACSYSIKYIKNKLITKWTLENERNHLFWQIKFFFFFFVCSTWCNGAGGIYDLYCYQPPGGEQGVLALLLGSHIVSVIYSLCCSRNEMLSSAELGPIRPCKTNFTFVDHFLHNFIFINDMS